MGAVRLFLGTGPEAADELRGCVSKLAYTKKMAIQVARRNRHSTGENIRAYRCPWHADHYHIGHPRGSL